MTGGFVGKTVKTRLKHRVVAKAVGAIAVFVAQGNARDPLSDLLSKIVDDSTWTSAV
jgi:hypothetical protein